LVNLCNTCNCCCYLILIDVIILCAILVKLIYLIREMKYVRKYDFLLSQVPMTNHGLSKLLQPRYDENHRGKTIFTGMQVQNDILLDLYLYIMNEYLVTKLNA
jgi:hypothetical protein